MDASQVNDLGERLYSEIKRLGGPSWACKYLNVAKNTPGNWRRNPAISLTQLDKISKAGADIDYILFGDQRRDQTPATDPDQEVGGSCLQAPEHCKAEKDRGLPERLKHIRGRRSQPQASRDWGIPLGTLRRYESGENAPDAERIALICEREGISADWLLFGRGPAPGSHQPQPAAAKPDAHDQSRSGPSIELIGRNLSAEVFNEIARRVVAAAYSSDAAPLSVIVRLER